MMLNAQAFFGNHATATALGNQMPNREWQGSGVVRVTLPDVVGGKGELPVFSEIQEMHGAGWAVSEPHVSGACQ